MKQKYRISGRAMAFAQAFFLYCWAVNLAQTDAYYSVYLLCALLGAFCLCDNYQKKPVLSKRVKRWSRVLAGIFAIATVLANYALFEPISALLSLFNAGCSLLGGFVLGYHVLVCGANRLPLAPVSQDVLDKRNHPARFFLICWGSLAVIYLLYLFCVGYPAYLAHDSIVTLQQIETGEYVNNNPFWYTMLIQVCVDTGMALLGEKNAAVAVFSVVQILLMTACFAYALVTLYQAGMHNWCLGAVYVLYGFMPYNLTYSITMWKDSMFGVSALLMTTALYRQLKQIGCSQRRNDILFVLGGIAFCLMRTNGWYSYLAMAVVMFFAMRKEHKKLLKIMGVVLVLCWILLNPVLTILGVGETDFIEIFAVPFQQVARVVANDREISEEDLELIGRTFKIEDVKALYDPGSVDPIKNESRRWDEREFFDTHLGDYFWLWVRLGLQYPGEYLKAWVEQTKGFWNSGYAFWIYIAYSYPESSGIGGFEMDNVVKDGFDALFRYLEKPVILQALVSIGLHAWAVFTCCFACAARKRKEFLLTIPVIVLLVGLWLGTPIYAEFRYAYPMFTSCPVILCATVFEGGEPARKERSILVGENS